MLGGSSARALLRLSSGATLGTGGCSPGVASASSGSKWGEQKSSLASLGGPSSSSPPSMAARSAEAAS